MPKKQQQDTIIHEGKMLYEQGSLISSQRMSNGYIRK